MKLRDLLHEVGCPPEVVAQVPRVDWELCPYTAGETADEVVHISLVPEIRSIYLEVE